MTDDEASLLQQKKLALSDICRRRGGFAEMRETHMSWLFLGLDRVYKLKKAVRYPFLDFSSVEKRRFFCFEELRLNRRLAASTYLSVLPLSRQPDGTLGVSDDGEAIDWVVEMLRLPERDMLDNRMIAASVKLQDIETLAALLASFYVALPSERVDGERHLSYLSEQMKINASVLSCQAFDLASQASPILSKARDELIALTPALNRRIADGWLREGHGDLRPEHICLSRPLQIIDCLEFNRMMRIVDPYEEAIHLGLECEIAGYPWVGDCVVARIKAMMGGQPDEDLLRFYTASKALLRARLCMAHLLEDDPRNPAKWRPLAVRYLRIAARELCIPPSQRDP